MGFVLLVLAHVEPKEVETLLNMGNLGFLFREFQPPVRKKLADERFNLSFEIFAIATGNHKIVGITDEVYLKWVTVWFVMSVKVDNFLQPIEYHVGNYRRNDTTLRGSAFGWEPVFLLHVTSFEPLSQNLFV